VYQLVQKKRVIGIEKIHPSGVFCSAKGRRLLIFMQSLNLQAKIASRCGN